MKINRILIQKDSNDKWRVSINGRQISSKGKWGLLEEDEDET